MNKIWDNNMAYDLFQIRKSVSLHYLFHLRGETSKSNKFIVIKNFMLGVMHD